MIHETHEFYFEDFVTDISRYLDLHQRGFLITAYDGYNTYVDKAKLAIKLAEFWQGNFSDK